ncbi:hypothetical protein [Psychrosphaera algicola]
MLVLGTILGGLFSVLYVIFRYLLPQVKRSR